MRRMRIGIVLLGLLLATGSAAHDAPKPKLRVGIRGIAGPDSLRVLGAWDSARDARHAVVQDYRAKFYAETNGVRTELVNVWVTGQWSLVRAFAYPLAGDTTWYQVCVHAIDSRNVESPEVCSIKLRVTTPWSPPTPPNVRIDTVAYNPSQPDGMVAYVAPPTWGGRVAVDRIAFRDTVTVCVIAWERGYGLVPHDVRWQSSDSGYASVTARELPGCALVTMLGGRPLPDLPAWPAHAALGPPW